VPEKRAAALWQLPEKNVFRPQKKSQFGIAQRFSFLKYPKNHPVSVQSDLCFDITILEHC